MCATPTFVDLQDFIVEKFVVKEVAILRDDTQLSHFFCPSFGWNLLTDGERKSADWLVCYYYRIRWNISKIDYRQTSH